MNNQKYIAGLYLRVSKDDARDGESGSIENQRAVLTQYARDNGWIIYAEYVDDGWSGVSFQRPAFERMLQDARDSRINLILVKDLSRLGRNYIEVGNLTENVFPSLGIRFVALGDQVDSLLESNEVAIYRNLFNEFLSKEISRKVRLGKRICMERGKYLGTYAPIGYKKDSINKHRLVIDYETAPLVRRIFDMRAAGTGFRTIAVTLNEENVPSPRTIYYAYIGKENPKNWNRLWSDSTVKVILRNEVYIGHTVQGKSGNISYKNQSQILKPKESWVRVENTHEPLISMETWNTVRSLDEKNYRSRAASDGSNNIFAGMLKCADCKCHMKANTEKLKRADGSIDRRTSFICGNYARSGKLACTIHTVGENALTALLLDEIRRNTQSTLCDEQRVIEQINQKQRQLHSAYLSTYQQEIKAIKTRLSQLDKVMKKLYEDHMHGTIPDSALKPLMESYGSEYECKTAALSLLQEKLLEEREISIDTGSYMDTIRQYMLAEVLTQDMLLALIDGIEVSEAEKIDGRRICRIRVDYHFSAVQSKGSTH